MYHMYHSNRAEFPDRKNSWSLYIFPWEGWKTPQPTVDDLEAKTLPKFLDLKPLKLGVLRRLQFQIIDSTMDDGEKN